MQDRADPLRDDDHRLVGNLFGKCRRSAASVFRSSAEKLSSKIKTCGCFAIALAMARRCFWPPDTLLPPCAMALSYPSFFSAIKSDACAISAASRICSSVASSLPNLKFDAMVPENSTPFCGYKTNLLPKFCHGKLPDINAVHGNASARHIIKTRNQVHQC